MRKRDLRRSASAFSLLELSIVVAIIGIMLAVAAPRYQGSLARYHADAAARRVIIDLQATRSAARQTSTSHTITFDLNADRISYTTPSERQASEWVSKERVTRLSASPYEADLVSANFGGHVKVTFDGFGKPTHGGTVVIEAHGVQRTVALNAHSGEASLQK